MTEKPQFIQQFERPAGTEIKHINGHWYLYERKNAYDPKTRRCHKVSGSIIGTITPEGLIPSRRNSPLRKAEELEIDNREYGATYFLYSLTEGMRGRLESLFPDCWREIYAVAMMKCKEDSPFKRASFHYCTSWLEQLLGPLGLSEGRLSQLLKRIGTDRQSVCSFMRDDLPDGSVLLFDGHRIISASETLENALVGYDSRCRYLPQINLAYMFNGLGGSHFPSYYKQFAGNVPDVVAFADTVQDAGLRRNSAVVVGDKGCGSELNEEQLEEAGLGYILAIRRGCGENVEPPQSISGYDRTFSYQDRVILCREVPDEKYVTYLYYDMCLANHEALDLVLRQERSNAVMERKRAAEDRRRRKGTGRMSPEEYDSLAPADVAETLHAHALTGTFALRTNRRDLNCMQVYISYKARTDIEQAFKFYDNELSGAASRMQDQNALEGWLFVNHLALQMLYEVINRISRMELTGKYSFRDLLAYLKHVHMNRIGGHWKMTKITRKTADICRSLDIVLTPEPSSKAKETASEKTSCDDK